MRLGSRDQYDPETKQQENMWVTERRNLNKASPSVFLVFFDVKDNDNYVEDNDSASETTYRRRPAALRWSEENEKEIAAPNRILYI